MCLNNLTRQKLRAFVLRVVTCASAVWFCAALGVPASADAASPLSPTPRDLEIRQKFCRLQPDEIQASLADEISSRLAFSNPRGPLDMGLCWWHSRFQRAAHSLIVYRPDRPRPDVLAIKQAFIAREAGKTIEPAMRRRLKLWEEVIEHIIEHRRVVEIPGYRNLFDFSRDFSFLIVKRLGVWQLREGILEFGWIEGVTGARKADAVAFKKVMDGLYREVIVRKRVAYLKTRFEVRGAFGGHSWIVPKMEVIKNGYRFWIIDSESPTLTIPLVYQAGDDSTLFSMRARETKYTPKDGGPYPFSIGMPELKHVDESLKIEKTRAAFCKRYQ